MVIDSPRNPRIRAAVALRERAARMALGQTLVDGAREALRAMNAGVVVEHAFICRSLIRSEEAALAVRTLELAAHPLVEVSERVHDRLAFGNRHDGLVLVVRTVGSTLDTLAPGPEPLILVTEDVEKPGNLGAILRTADAVGCAAVIAIGGTDMFNPNVVRASVGTVFSVPVVAATPSEAIAWLIAHGIRPIAATVDAPAIYTDANLTGALALVLGSEADGLSAAWSGAGIEHVRIPMAGTADSLNVSVAAAVLAFEARRQRDGQQAR
ncbi:MAG: TrmH family RNA methyltransferase [Chloroflexota bacterium]